MAGSGRFDITSSNPDSGFVGSRGNSFGPSLSRSGSFRERGESRLFDAGTTDSQVSGMIGNMPPLSQCLMLEPITMGEQNHTRSGELKRVLGFSAGSSSEENSFEELKHYKDNIIDLNNKARFRTKKLDEHLHKLNKYVEVVNYKKKARNGSSSNERSSMLNLKMGAQGHQNVAEVVPQRLEDRAKNTLINKRVRTSMAESRAESRSNGVARQYLVMAQDRVLHKDNSPSSDLIEEKVRRLPPVGEGWDKKMKRKRSMSTSFTRPLDSEGELKRSMHHKVINESGLQSGDAQGFRSGHGNSVSGTNKLDGSSLPANSLPRATLHEPGKAALVRDLPTGLNKGKPLDKGNNGLNAREDNHIPCPNPPTKLKASRAPRSSSVAAPNSSLSSPHASENGEQPFTVNKNFPVGIVNNRKRGLPAGSASPPMAQWVGQRPQKISRTRRANLVSPVSNHEEGNVTHGGCSPPSDLSTKISSGGASVTPMSRGMSNGLRQVKVKCENVSSPARFSGVEESGACESGLKEKVEANDAVDNKAVSSVQVSGSSSVTKKNKPLAREESGDGVRRQGRTGRGSFPMATISPSRKKLDNVIPMKPVRTMIPCGEKNGSKAGRPLKKQLDRRGFSRRGPNSSSDLTGESDDREELLAAVLAARNASNQSCSSSFWKQLEPIFGPASMQDISYFSHQGDLGHVENSGCDGIGFGEINRGMENQVELKESARNVEFADQFQEFDIFCGKLDSDRILNRAAPLCQRVLSALILEDEVEELEDNYMERNASGPYTNDLACDSEPGDWDEMEYEYGSGFGAQPANRIFPCNGKNKTNRSSVVLNPQQNGYLHADVGVFVSHFGHDMDESQIVQRNGFTVSSLDSEYEKMGVDEKLLLELHSIGIHLDIVPDLDDEDETLSQEIIQLKQGLRNQAGRKKTCLDKVNNLLQQGKEAETGKLEMIAMDKLVESAHRKLLATRGSITSKYGIAKMSKQGALSFSKRTLTRCKAFEETGTSCFNEPALRDAMFAESSLGNVVEDVTGDCARLGSKLNGTGQHSLHRDSAAAFENFVHQSDDAFAKNGPIFNRGRKKEVLLDDVGEGTALRPNPTFAGSALGGAKGKRSERERDGNIPKVGRPSLNNLRGERKSKTRPKQKTAQLSTPGNGSLNKFDDTKHQKRDGGLISPVPTQSSSKENPEEEEEEALDFSAFPLPDLDTLDALGGNDVGQDLNCLLNFDDMGLPDHDSNGLAIPMDDLSELNMF